MERELSKMKLEVYAAIADFEIQLESSINGIICERILHSSYIYYLRYSLLEFIVVKNGLHPLQLNFGG